MIRYINIKYISLVVFVLVTIAGFNLPASADMTSLIRKWTMDHLELEVHVNDAHQQALKGAIIWYVDNPLSSRRGITLDTIALSRMAKRYARLSDFLDTNDLPGAVFERADLQGIYRDFRESSSASGKFYPYILVATKRGYLPQIIEGAAPLNRRHTVTLTLQIDTQFKSDARMEEFDQLMAQAQSPVLGEDLVGEARMRKLDALQEQARALAQSLEKEGRVDDASAIYWALSNFPEVIRTTSPDGNVQVVGYRNGKENVATNPDRLHAIQLNTTVPKLLMHKLLMSRGFIEVGINEVKKGTTYLEIFEQLASGQQQEQVLPHEYKVAIYQVFRWGTPDKTCSLLQRAYQFEPAIMSPNDWWKFLNRLQKWRTDLHLPVEECVLHGLPAR